MNPQISTENDWKLTNNQRIMKDRAEKRVKNDSNWQIRRKNVNK